MRRAVVFIMTLLFILLPGTVFGIADDASKEEVFYRANEAYKLGRFEEAAKGYDELIQAGYANGHLHFNLGNSYFRMGLKGKAILQYERAYSLMPRDADLLFNLRYVKDQRIDAVQERQSLIAATFFWINSFNLAEFYWAFIIFNALVCAVLVLRLFMSTSWMSSLLITAVFCWFGVAGSFALKWYDVHFDDRAIILDKEINILAGPDEGDTVLFKLHEGTYLHQERTEGQWVLIRLSADKRGWVKAKGIAKIRTGS